MQGWLSQIVVGVIVTVIGTVLANAITRDSHGGHFKSAYHFSGLSKAGR